MEYTETLTVTDEFANVDLEPADPGAADETTRLDASAACRFETELANTVKTMEDLVREIEKSGLTARYLLGKEVLGVQNNANYGENAVGFLATKLRLSARTLRTHARVVSAFPDQTAFDAMTGADRPGTRPMGWAHVVELATVDDAFRDELVRRTIAEGLTVSALRDLKAQASPPNAAPSGAKVASAPTKLQSKPRTGSTNSRSKVAPQPVGAPTNEVAVSDAHHEPEQVPLETAVQQLTETVRRMLVLAQPNDRNTRLQVIQALRAAADELESHLSDAGLEANP